MVICPAAGHGLQGYCTYRRPHTSTLLRFTVENIADDEDCKCPEYSHDFNSAIAALDPIPSSIIFGSERIFNVGGAKNRHVDVMLLTEHNIHTERSMLFELETENI